jgi:hypothetical protein
MFTASMATAAGARIVTGVYTDRSAFEARLGGNVGAAAREGRAALALRTEQRGG